MVINLLLLQHLSGPDTELGGFNRYVLHNKIYYRAGGGSARQMNQAPEFVPVIFDDEQPDEELQPDGSWMSGGDGCIYDL